MSGHGREVQKHEALKESTDLHLSKEVAAHLHNDIESTKAKWSKATETQKEHYLHQLNADLKEKLPAGVQVAGFDKSGHLILIDSKTKDGNKHLYVMDEHGKVTKSLEIKKDSHGAYTENTNKTNGSTTKHYFDGHAVRHYKDNSEVTTDPKGHPTEIKDKAGKLVCKAEYDKGGNVTKFTDHEGNAYDKGTGTPPKWTCTKSDGTAGSSWTGTIRPDGKGGIITDDGTAGAGHKFSYDHTGNKDVGDVKPAVRTGDTRQEPHDNTLTDPSGKPVDMVHPCQVDLGNGRLRMYGAAGSDNPGMKHDGNMIVSVPLDASGKPTDAPQQVQIDGLDAVLRNTGGKPGTSNPAVFRMKNGQVGMVFEVDKKDGQGTTQHSDFYLAVSSDGGRTFKMSNESKPVMRGSDNDPFISVPRVVENANGGYSMYFCKTGRDHNTPAVATSSDGQNWSAPKEIKVAGSGLQSGAAIMDPDVQTYTGTDGRTHYRMLFTTNNRTGPFDNNGRTTIWMADSIDGKNFTGAREVVQPAGNAVKVMDPQVVTVSGKSYLQYVQVQDGKMRVMQRQFEG